MINFYLQKYWKQKLKIQLDHCIKWLWIINLYLFLKILSIIKYKNYGDNSGAKMQYRTPNLPLMQRHHYNNRIIPSPSEDKTNAQVHKD